MTETRPPQGIDPRFDPRFQRGYDGEVDAPVAPFADERPAADAAASVAVSATPRDPLCASSTISRFVSSTRPTMARPR